MSFFIIAFPYNAKNEREMEVAVIHNYQANI